MPLYRDVRSEAFCAFTVSVRAAEPPGETVTLDWSSDAVIPVGAGSSGAVQHVSDAT